MAGEGEDLGASFLAAARQVIGKQTAGGQASGFSDHSALCVLRAFAVRDSGFLIEYSLHEVNTTFSNRFFD